MAGLEDNRASARRSAARLLPHGVEERGQRRDLGRLEAQVRHAEFTGRWRDDRRRVGEKPRQILRREPAARELRADGDRGLVDGTVQMARDTALGDETASP